MSDEEGTEEGKQESLKKWILEEMVSGRDEDQKMIDKVLSECKDDVKALVKIREDGKVTIQRFDAPPKLQILSYLIGIAYGRVAELRQDDAVSPKEVIDGLGLKEGTVHPYMKKLTEEDLLVQKKQGLYRINYRKLKDILAEFQSD